MVRGGSGLVPEIIRVTPFRVQGVEDPAGILTRSFILQLAEAWTVTGTAVDLGYQFSASKPRKWKEDLRDKGFAALAKYGYHFGEDPQSLFEYAFIDKLALVLHSETDPIIDDAVDTGDAKREAAARKAQREMKRELGAVGNKI